MTIREFVDAEYAIVRNLRPKAHYQIRLTLTRWAEFLGREPEKTDLTNLAVMSFLRARQTKVARGSMLKDRNHICGVWNYLAKQDRGLSFPTLPPMSPIRRIPRAYTASDVSAVLRVALGLPGAIAGLPRGYWWASIIRASWETAERISAVRSLVWDDADLAGCTLIYRGENRKGGRADIQRSISPQTAEWLGHLRQGRGGADMVWPWPKTDSTLWLEFGRIATLAQVTNRGFHGFRKSAASYLTAAGDIGAASQHLGHSSTKMTLDHYVDPDIARPATSTVSLLPALDLGDWGK